MADVYVNALTQLTEEPTANDSLVAVNRNTNEGQIIDYNLLADVILNKLSSKQYSALSTESKTLIGALNEHESDVSALTVLTVDCGTISALPKTVSNANITSDMVVVESTLGTPSAQTADWTVNTANGSVTISGSISGSTTLVLYLSKSR